MSLGKRGQQAQASPAQVLCTLGGQHGTCCLLEVQKLLQEQDGLVEKSHTRGSGAGNGFPHVPFPTSREVLSQGSA